MRRQNRSPSLIAEINITPFTDVILVLLIIFIIATPLISQSNIEIQLPEVTSKETLDVPKPAYIPITGEGIVYFENRVLTNKELKQKINDLLAKDSDLKVVVAADQASRFQEVIRVIDILKESGVKSLNIATRTSQEEDK